MLEILTHYGVRFAGHPPRAVPLNLYRIAEQRARERDRKRERERESERAVNLYCLAVVSSLAFVSLKPAMCAAVPMLHEYVSPLSQFQHDGTKCWPVLEIKMSCRLVPLALASHGVWFSHGCVFRCVISGAVWLEACESNGEAGFPSLPEQPKFATGLHLLLGPMPNSCKTFC